MATLCSSPPSILDELGDGFHWVLADRIPFSLGVPAYHCASERYHSGVCGVRRRRHKRQRSIPKSIAHEKDVPSHFGNPSIEVLQTEIGLRVNENHALLIFPEAIAWRDRVSSRPLSHCI